MHRLSVAALSLSYHVALGSFASCTHHDTSSQCTTVLLLTTASYCLAVSTTTTSPSRPRTVEASHRRGEMARSLGASNSYYCHLAVFSCVLGVLGVVLLVLLAPYVVLWTGIMPISFWPPYGSQRSFSRAYPPLGAVESNCSVGTLAFVASSASGPLPWVGLPGRVPGLVPPSWCTPSRPPPGVLDHWLCPPLFWSVRGSVPAREYILAPCLVYFSRFPRTVPRRCMFLPVVRIPWVPQCDRETPSGAVQVVLFGPGFLGHRCFPPN